jgi:hypothetical protein
MSMVWPAPAAATGDCHSRSDLGSSFVGGQRRDAEAGKTVGQPFLDLISSWPVKPMQTETGQPSHKGCGIRVAASAIPRLPRHAC